MQLNFLGESSHLASQIDRTSTRLENSLAFFGGVGNGLRASNEPRGVSERGLDAPVLLEDEDFVCLGKLGPC